MSTTHENLVKKAKEAIAAVFSDTSVSPTSTRLSLESLIDEVQARIDSLPNDDEEE